MWKEIFITDKISTDKFYETHPRLYLVKRKVHGLKRYFSISSKIILFNKQYKSRKPLTFSMAHVLHFGWSIVRKQLENSGPYHRLVLNAVGNANLFALVFCTLVASNTNWVTSSASNILSNFLIIKYDFHEKCSNYIRNTVGVAYKKHG